MSARRLLRLMTVLGVLAAAVVAGQTLAGLDAELLLLLAPALMLALPLLAGRYVGEERLERWRTAFTPRARRAVVRLAARVPRGAGVSVVTGGALIAASLARRGPPRRAFAVA